MEVGLFLKATGIGVDVNGPIKQPCHVEIADRIDHDDALRDDACPSECIAGARMHREDDSPILGLVTYDWYIDNGTLVATVAAYNDAITTNYDLNTLEITGTASFNALSGIGPY